MSKASVTSATFDAVGAPPPWHELGLDVLPSLLMAVTVDDVAQALTRGAVRRFATACALDLVDATSGGRRAAIAHVADAVAPAARWAPTGLPAAWSASPHAIVAATHTTALFPDMGGGDALGVPLASGRGRLWLLARHGESFDDDAIAAAHELARWTDASLARACTLEAAERQAKRHRDLGAIVEHDLRSPLGTLLGWARLLANEPALDSDRARRGLTAIARGGSEMTRVIEDWHEASRMLLGDVELTRAPTAIAPLVESVASARRATIESHGTKLTLELADDAVADVDAARVRDMTERMLDRIERTTPAGGTIAVRVAIHGRAVVVVAEGRDDDTSLSPVRARSSAPPVKLADRTLTLAMVRGIAELHGGSAGAERTGASAGSRIWALLPIRARARETSDARPVETDLRGIHVLLVDDAVDSLELAATIVRLRGARATLASSTAEAIEHLRTLPIDVLVSDIAMPVEDGCTLIRRAHELRPDLRAAALSAHTQVEERERALSAGFETYLTKPVEPAALALVIRSLAHEIPSVRGA